MNLRDTRIDLDGQAVVSGRLRYPIDDNGYFTLKPHDCIRIGYSNRKKCLRLAAATSVRDPVSGFLIAEEKGVTVIVPDSLSSIIRAGLRRPPPRPLLAKFSGQGEGLRWHSEINPEVKDNLRRQALPFSDPDSSKRQPLSDWELEIIAEGDLLKVQISAALFATETDICEKDYIGHWSIINNSPPRVEIEFAVDLATRIAAFHTAYIPSGTQVTVDSEKPFSTTLGALKLASAPINTRGEIFAVTRNGEWASFETENESILITPHFSKQRLANGFLLCDTGHRPPSISLRGFALNTLLRPLWREPKHMVTFEFRNGTFGSLIQGREFHERYDPTPMQLIQHAVLELRVGITGLQFAYRLYINDLDVSQKNYKAGWLEDWLVIPWEIVILRYSELLWHRDALLNDQTS